MKCNICKTLTKKIIDDKMSKLYHQCSNCETIWLDNGFFVDKTKEKMQYENHNNSFESTGYVKMFEDFLNYFWQDLPNNYTDAFDFGSGPGPVLAEILKQRGLNVDCYDKFYQPFKIYENKKYDLITSTEVFEHIQNPLETLKLFKDHLKQDGLISIMTLFHKNDTEEFLNWWYRRDPTHISFYTPHSFEVMAHMCGLKVIKHDNKRVIILTSLE
ncbi:MAG: class I SAM-dependent methyltransferase [Sulfurospirillaceae bacterium]|nr:class I SAM-dependent methyltransferase [Sulfurospirillaceae bacterium]